jgi:hypothetical protein
MMHDDVAVGRRLDLVMTGTGPEDAGALAALQATTTTALYSSILYACCVLQGLHEQHVDHQQHSRDLLTCLSGLASLG